MQCDWGDVGIAVGYEKMRDGTGTMDGKLVGKLTDTSPPDDRIGSFTSEGYSSTAMALNGPVPSAGIFSTKASGKVSPTRILRRHNGRKSFHRRRHAGRWTADGFKQDHRRR